MSRRLPLLLLTLILSALVVHPTKAQAPILPDGLHVYYGDLHSHTSYSDGQRTPQDAYRSARSHGLDFFALTDHVEQLSDREWDDTLVQARAATVEGQFIALRGFEWTSIYGHLNVLNSANRARANDPRYDTIAEFYAWLSDPAQINAVAQFNHPFYPPQDPFDAWRYDPRADLHISLIEVRNSSHLCEEEYRDAMRTGWHIGGTNNSDTHRPDWGIRRARTGLLAPALTYHDILDSLRLRRTFSTDDPDLSLILRADGHWMGAVIADGPYHLQIYARDPDITDTLASLELYHNGHLLRSFPIPDGTRALTATHILTAPPTPGDWWYAKAVQTDGDEAYTAPIWTLAPPPDDVAVRDNLQDEGFPPSPGFPWESPDVWIRRRPDHLPWGRQILPGATNYLHLHLIPLGGHLPTTTQISLYWAEPLLDPAWPDDWHLITTLSADDSTSIVIPWDVPPSVSPDSSLLIRLDSPGDPLTYDGHPRWDNNLARRSVHLITLGDHPAQGSPTTAEAQFILHNHTSAIQTGDLRFTGDAYPPTGRLTLTPPPALFDRWTSSGGTVRGGFADTTSHTIVITAPTDGAVYGLPLLAGERLPVNVTFHAPVSALLAVRITWQVNGEQSGGYLYATDPAPTPRRIFLTADPLPPLTDHPLTITATVVGAGHLPVADGLPVHFETTAGRLDEYLRLTRDGLVTTTFTPDRPGPALIRAVAPGLPTATLPIEIHTACQARLNDGTTTYDTVQAAVDAATSPDDIIKVAGRCTVTTTRSPLGPQILYIAKSLTVRGGYTYTNWTTPDPVAHPTVLDAQGRGRGIIIVGDITPTVEYLQITGGVAADVGGGLLIVGAAATLRGNRIVGNRAACGGGLYLTGDARLINNLIAANDGSGLCVGGGEPRLWHTTIADNDGPGLLLFGGRAYLTNTILASHTVDISGTAGATVTLDGLLWNGGTLLTGGRVVLEGHHLTQGDPDFRAPGDHDYHLGPHSAALDAGLPTAVATDWDGEPRPMGHAPDLGADELPLTLRAGLRHRIGVRRTGVRLTYTLAVTDTGQTPLHLTVEHRLPDAVETAPLAGGTTILPGGRLRWTTTLASGVSWTRTVAVTVVRGFSGPLTALLKATAAEGATGVTTDTLALAPALTLTVRQHPAPATSNRPLLYTLAVTNTGNLDLYTVVTDYLPAPVSPSGPFTWAPLITAPGGVWRHTLTVTPTAGYAGLLTNILRATSSAGATGLYTLVGSVAYRLHLPLLLRDYAPPEPCYPRTITSIPAGPEPHGLALDPIRRRAFVAHAGGLTVIDTRTYSVITTTTAEVLFAHGVTYDPDRDHIWVARRNPDRVVVLDGTTYTPLAVLPTGDTPHAAAYNPANGRVYVTCYAAGTVEIYDAAVLTRTAELTGFGEPAHLAVNPLTDKIYVANHRSNYGLGVIDGATDTWHLLPLDLIDGYGVAVDTARDLIYVAAIAHGRIAILDGATETPLGYRDFRDGESALWLRALAVDPDLGETGHLFIVTSSADGERDQLLLVPGGPSLGEPVALDMPPYPQDGLIVERETARVWVASVGSGLATVVQDGDHLCPVDDR